MIAPMKRADVNFSYLKNIGQAGKNSDVYLARDEHLDAEVAIKEVDKSTLKTTDYFTEARLLYASRHPNIVSINYACQDTNNIYVCMPFYPKGTVSDRMQKERLTAREIIRYSINFLSGLHHIHSKSLMHFDIKPNNIMLSDRDEAMLSDFGLAKNLCPNGFATPNAAYTIHYPPESFTHTKFNITYDIYQAGMTMYRMAVGFDSFQSEVNSLFADPNNAEKKIITGAFPNKKFEPHIPRPLRKIIVKCLSINPGDRYQSALEVLNALSAIDKVCLDWRKEDNKTHLVWSKPKEQAKLIFKVDKNTAACELYKLNPDGTKRRDKQNCRSAVSESDIYMILKGN